MSDDYSEIRQQLAVPKYAPRPQPTIIPTAAWNDAPLFCLQVNDEWVSHILGVLTALDQPDTWIGTEEEIFAARQQVNEIMLALMTTCEPAPPVGNGFWTDEDLPGNTAFDDNPPIELGLKFGSTVAGNVLGVRFYKSATNVDTHVGQLFTSDGTLLGTVTFTDETAEGWQSAYFDEPIAIDAATIYVVAYHTNVGQYSYDLGYFTDEFDRSPLYAPASGTVGGNGVYLYSTDPAFPSDASSGSNYWVDVIFEPTT